MLQDRLQKAVRRRLMELGLDPSLMDLDNFRENLLRHQWVMVVRDGDAEADVHLYQPPPGKQLRRPRRSLTTRRPSR